MKWANSSYFLREITDKVRADLTLSRFPTDLVIRDRALDGCTFLVASALSEGATPGTGRIKTRRRINSTRFSWFSYILGALHKKHGDSDRIAVLFLLSLAEVDKSNHSERLPFAASSDIAPNA